MAESSFTKVHKVLVPVEPTHMEDEDESENQENDKGDERDGDEWRVEEYQDNHCA